MGARNILKTKKESELYEEDDSESAVDPIGPSEIAKELVALTAAIKNASNKRATLPQPLFWSLFQRRICEIKKKKETAAVIREILEN